MLFLIPTRDTFLAMLWSSIDVCSAYIYASWYYYNYSHCEVCVEFIDESLWYNISSYSG